MMISDVEIKYCVSCGITHVVPLQEHDCFPTFLSVSVYTVSVYFHNTMTSSIN